MQASLTYALGLWQNGFAENANGFPLQFTFGGTVTAGTTVADSITLGTDAVYDADETRAGWGSQLYAAGWKPSPEDYAVETIRAKQNVSKVVTVKLRDGNTGKGKDGVVPTFQLTKTGGALTVITPAYVGLGNGLYAVTLTAGNLDTVGMNVLRVSAPAANPGQVDALSTEVVIEVVLADDVNVVQWLGAAPPTPTTAGVPMVEVDATAISAIATAILDAARSGHVTVGSVGEAIALSASLLQGNFYIDNVTNTDNGQTAARLRCFHTGAAAAAATQGGTGQGEFATFLVTTTYSGPNKITDHRVVQQ